MMVPAQQLSTASVIQQVDAAVKARTEYIEGYSVTEHYAVYRSKDEIHPVAEMTVITSYQKNSGKTYTIVSQTGSNIVRSLVLNRILDNEKLLSQPGIREGAWITSANYEMTLKPGGTQRLDGRDCLVVGLTPKAEGPLSHRRNPVGRLAGWFDSSGSGNVVQEFFVDRTHAGYAPVCKHERLSAGHPR